MVTLSHGRLVTFKACLDDPTVLTHLVATLSHGRLVTFKACLDDPPVLTHPVASMFPEVNNSM